MALQVGSRLGHYDVTALIGEEWNGPGLSGDRSKRGGGREGQLDDEQR
jgi:hypothetical protein